MNRSFRTSAWVYFWLICFLFPHPSFSQTQAKEPVALKVLPENVGVFYELKTQQFQAIAIFADGSEEDYTEKVGWSIVAYPFKDQTLPPEQIAKIDRKGLATVLHTWGRVVVLATYPPPPPFTPSAISLLLLKQEQKLPHRPALPGILSLLLSRDPLGSVTPASNPQFNGFSRLPKQRVFTPIDPAKLSVSASRAEQGDPERVIHERREGFGKQAGNRSSDDEQGLSAKRNVEPEKLFPFIRVDENSL